VNLQIKQVGPNRRELLIKSPSGETRIFFSYGGLLPLRDILQRNYF